MVRQSNWLWILGAMEALQLAEDVSCLAALLAEPEPTSVQVMLRNRTADDLSSISGHVPKKIIKKKNESKEREPGARLQI